LLDVSKKLTIILPPEDFWGYIIRGPTKCTGGVSSPQALLWEQAEKATLISPTTISSRNDPGVISHYQGKQLACVQT
jgi:hypothetical protein